MESFQLPRGSSAAPPTSNEASIISHHRWRNDWLQRVGEKNCEFQRRRVGAATPMDGEVISIVFFSKKHSQFGGGLEIEIRDADGFRAIITFFSEHWLSNQYKIKSFVNLGEKVQKGTPITFIPFFSTVKISLPGSSNIMARSGNSLHAGFSHLIIKGLE